jgi:phosphoribosylanthranilate isomerase
MSDSDSNASTSIPWQVPQIKFCGFTRSEDVEAACQLGVDAIGLNFYPKSPRSVSIEQASELAQIAAGRTIRVGVFVNASPESVAKVLESCQLDAIQLHGDETIDWNEKASRIEALRGYPIVRALAWRASNTAAGETVNAEDSTRAKDWKQVPSVSCWLIDAHDPVQFGGTGKTARWDLLFPRPDVLSTKPLLLAGGLTAYNLDRAIQIARPYGVDIASGIETRPGIKDLTKMSHCMEIFRSEMTRFEPPS